MPDTWDLPGDETDDDAAFRPGDADYELSEAAGYRDGDPPAHGHPIPRWIIVAVSLLIVAGLVLPGVIIIAR